MDVMLSRKQIECLPEENLNAHAETIAKQKGSLRNSLGCCLHIEIFVDAQRVSHSTFSKSFLSLDSGIVQSNPALHVFLLSSPGSELGSKLDPGESG